MKVSQCVRLNN